MPELDMNTRVTGAIKRLRRSHPELHDVIRVQLPIPAVYRGEGPIRLIVLGQDPTINDPAKVAGVSTVLNLDRAGPLRTYIRQICNILKLDLGRHIYATNLVKPFLVAPPVKLAKQVEFDLFALLRDIWTPLLLEELEAFPDVPVLSLGEPLLQALAVPGAKQHVRHYWGYTPLWKEGDNGAFAYLAPEENRLQRRLYPFPHLTSARANRFYSDRLAAYTRFLGETTGFVEGLEI